MCERERNGLLREFWESSSSHFIAEAEKQEELDNSLLISGFSGMEWGLNYIIQYIFFKKPCILITQISWKAIWHRTIYCLLGSVVVWLTFIQELSICFSHILISPWKLNRGQGNIKKVRKARRMEKLQVGFFPVHSLIFCVNSHGWEVKKQNKRNHSEGHGYTSILKLILEKLSKKKKDLKSLAEKNCTEAWKWNYG